MHFKIQKLNIMMIKQTKADIFLLFCQEKLNILYTLHKGYKNVTKTL